MSRRSIRFVDVVGVTFCAVVLIAILGLFFPPVQATGGFSRRTQSANNLNQIGKAMIMYMGDFDDHYVVPERPCTGQKGEATVCHEYLSAEGEVRPEAQNFAQRPALGAPVSDLTESAKQ